MKVSDFVVDYLARRTGARHAFMLSGGMAMHLVESFGTHPAFTVVPMHHEQAAGIAASCYARVRECTGVLMVTAGPGALNAVTPCGGAWMESVPLVVVSGQVSRANGRNGQAVRQRGIQEVEIIDVVRSITKYAAKIEDPGTLVAHLAAGLEAATSGRPGPVWFDIPVDVQALDLDLPELDGLTGSPAADRATTPAEKAAVQRVLDRLAAAERPLLVLGGGVRLAGAAALVPDFIKQLGVPVQTSWNGMDLVDSADPLVYARANVFGPRAANMIFQNADCILAIGARFGIQHTGYNVAAFARGAHLIMVDVDETEMDKPGLRVAERVVMDARRFIQTAQALLPATQTRDLASWREHCDGLTRKYPLAPSFDEVRASPYIDPKYFITRLAEVLPANAVFPFGSSGMGHTITGGIFKTKLGQRVFTFKGLAAMGYGVPCVVGAAFAAPDRPVLTIVGEGGLQLNLQELQTIRHWQLPTKIIVLNNGGYHSIHMTQRGFFKGHFVASGPESGVSFPPLAKLAEVYGFAYHDLRSNDDVDAVLERFLAEPGPAFLEVFVDPAGLVGPRIVNTTQPDGSIVSRPIEDMAPLLGRDELQADMLIPLEDA